MRLPQLAVLLASACVVAGCKSGTAPQTTHQGGPAGPTHPAGNAEVQIIGLGGRPFGLNVAATGGLLVTEQDLNQVVHLDSLGGSPANIAVGRDPGDVVATSAGTAFVSGYNDGSVSVVDLSTNTILQAVHVSRTNAYRLALSKDESRLYITSADGHLYTMNTASRAVTDSVSLNVFDGLTLDHAGTTLYATAASGTVWRIDAPGLTTARQASLGCAAKDVALATDDSEVYVACEDGSIAVLDPTSLSTKAVISPPGAAPFGLAVSPDNAQLYVASALTHSLTIIDRATRTVVKTLQLAGTPRRVVFNKLGTKAYVSNEGNWIDVIE
jgi:YVTN family beta-propeller protein